MAKKNEQKQHRTAPHSAGSVRQVSPNISALNLAEVAASSPIKFYLGSEFEFGAKFRGRIMAELSRNTEAQGKWN